MWENGEKTKGDIFHISNTIGEFMATRYGECQKLVKALKAIRGICRRNKKNPLTSNNKGQEVLDLHTVSGKGELEGIPGCL